MEGSVTKKTKLVVAQFNYSRLRKAARKVGIDIDRPEPHLPVTEREETDTM